jgi:hypothetical protein
MLVSYYWLDRHIATFIFEHHWRDYLSQLPGLKSLVEWPSKMSCLAPIVFFLLLLFRKSSAHKNAH